MLRQLYKCLLSFIISNWITVFFLSWAITLNLCVCTKCCWNAHGIWIDRSICSSVNVSGISRVSPVISHIFRNRFTRELKAFILYHFLSLRKPFQGAFGSFNFKIVLHIVWHGSQTTVQVIDDQFQRSFPRQIFLSGRLLIAVSSLMYFKNSRYQSVINVSMLQLLCTYVIVYLSLFEFQSRITEARSNKRKNTVLR